MRWGYGSVISTPPSSTAHSPPSDSGWRGATGSEANSPWRKANMQRRETTTRCVSARTRGSMRSSKVWPRPGPSRAYRSWIPLHPWSKAARKERPATSSSGNTYTSGSTVSMSSPGPCLKRWSRRFRTSAIRAIFRNCRKKNALNAWRSPAGTSHRLAVYVRDAFLARPPFTNQLYHDRRMERATQEVKKLSVHAKPDNFESILTAYRQAIEASPRDWQLRRLLAQFLLSVGKYVEAERQYRLAMQGLPEFHSIALYSGLCNALSGQGRIDEVISYYQEIVKRKPHLAPAHFQLAQALPSERRDRRGNRSLPDRC